MTPDEMRKRAKEIRNSSNSALDQQGHTYEHADAQRLRAALYDIGAEIVEALQQNKEVPQMNKTLAELISEKEELERAKQQKRRQPFYDF